MPGNGRKVSLYLSERGSTVTAVLKSALICKGVLTNKRPVTIPKTVSH